LRGRIRVKLDRDTNEVEQGQMMILSPGIPHAVEALDETAFMILVSATELSRQ